MGRDTLSAIPATVVQNTTVAWYVDAGEFPVADGWTLTYEFRGSTSLTVTCTTSGEQYLATITPAQSAALTVGDDYWWALYAHKGSGATLERYEVDRGRLSVERTLGATLATYDGRSHAKIVLDAIEAVIQGKASKDQKDVMVGDRRIARLLPAEIEQWRAFYRSEYEREKAAEDIAAGRPHRNLVLTEFKSA